MSLRAKQTGNGTYEFDDYMRQPDKRTKWEVFKDFLYNPQDGTIFGHTKKRWGIVGLFYLVFYAGLAVLCAICTMGLLATIDDKRPSYTMASSLIGTNPGLGFRPINIDSEKGPMIRYSSSNETSIRKWVTHLDEFLEIYQDKAKLPNAGRNQVICDYDKPPMEGKVCAVDVSNLGPCSSSQSYGFNNSSPCVFIKLNRIFDWAPEYYNNSKDLPENMPQDLKDHIAMIDKSKLNTIWISCKGERQDDIDIIGDLEYFPKYRGFPGFFYPYTNQPEYISPVVAVHFKRPQRNKVINVECRAWAKNIFYKSQKGEKAGAVHFELRIDD